MTQKVEQMVAEMDTKMGKMKVGTMVLRKVENLVETMAKQMVVMKDTQMVQQMVEWWDSLMVALTGFQKEKSLVGNSGSK